MKDEIKEILEHAKSKGYIDLDYEESELLLDYITNLQQIEQDHQKLNGELREELEDYKSRNEKAMEYLEQNPVIEINGEFRNIYSEDDDKLLNILNGGDKE